MKKTLATLIALLMVMCSLPALAEDAQTPAQALPKGIHVLTMQGYRPMDMELLGLMTDNKVEGTVSIDVFGEITEIQSLNEALMQLQSGRADAFFTFDETARYLAARNEGMMSVTGFLPATLHIMADLGKEDLIAKINDALASMQEDGTLDSLYATYVEGVIAGEDPAPIEMPVIDGAETVTIGVSGDTPPLDYTTADGLPAGYNTAVLAEIAARAELNIELVTLESGARFTALKSGRIDAFFWHWSFEMMADLDVNDHTDTILEAVSTEGELLLSDSYSEIYFGWLLMKPE